MISSCGQHPVAQRAPDETRGLFLAVGMTARTRRQITNSDPRVEFGGIHLVVTLKTGVFLHSDGVAKRAVRLCAAVTQWEAMRQAEIRRHPVLGVMAVGTGRPEQTSVNRWFSVAGEASGRSFLVVISQVTEVARHGRVCSGERESRPAVIETTEIHPGRGYVTVGTGRSELAEVNVVHRVAADAVLGKPAQLTVHVAVLAGGRNMRSSELEASQIVVKRSQIHFAPARG